MSGDKIIAMGLLTQNDLIRLGDTFRGGSVCLNRLARLLSGASAGFMPLREAVG